MAEFKHGQLLRIFIAEHATWRGCSLHAALVDLLHRENIAGASVFRGVEGIGSRHEIHAAKVFALGGNLPVLIEVVDDEEKIAALIPKIEPMIGDGTLTLERVEYCRFSKPAARGAH